MIAWAESLLPSQRLSRERMKETLRQGHVTGWLGTEIGCFHTTRPHDISAGNLDNTQNLHDTYLYDIKCMMDVAHEHC